MNLEVHCVACNKGFYGEVCLLWRRATTLLGRDAERGDDAAGAQCVEGSNAVRARDVYVYGSPTNLN